MSSLTNSVVCEEIFDETSSPSVDEIRDYASKIGIDPESEPQLLPLAAEGLMKALPAGWKPVYDEKRKTYYYYNNHTGKTQWEHPLDDLYRDLVKKKRTESQSLSLGEPNEDATYTRDDLPSFEEPPAFKHHLEPLGVRRKDVVSGKLGALDFHAPGKLLRQKSEEKPIVNYMNRKIGLSLSTSFDGKPDEFADSPRKDFKLLGGGAMFLKSKTKPLGEGSSSSKDVPKHDVIDSLVDDNKIVGDNDKELKDNPPRGILRERNMVEVAKGGSEDDVKNVRFNIDEASDTLDDIFTKTLSKSRFSSIITNTDYNNFDEVKNLKLIKPNPIDFIKPKIKGSEQESSNAISDSEDDSLLKSIEKIASTKPAPTTSGDIIGDVILSEEHKQSIGAKYREDNVAILNQLKQNADRELEDMKKSIWNEKNEEIAKYKDSLLESQKGELERILSNEKSKYEENIRKELETLRLEMESRNLGALEVERVRLEERLQQAKTELEQEYEAKRTQLKTTLQSEMEQARVKLEKQHGEKLEEATTQLERELEKHKDELIVSHNAILDQMKQNHQALMDEIKRDYKSEEKILRKEHESQLLELKKKVVVNIDNEMNNSNHSKDTNEERLYEKVRCEKRLLEDKYRCLKEKYLRLKTDVKLSIEKRNRKREQSATTTTGSETERSNSINKERSPHRSPNHLKVSDKPPLVQKNTTDLNCNRSAKPEHKSTRTIIIQDLDTSTSDKSCKNDAKNNENGDSSEDNAQAGRSRKKLFSKIKTNTGARLSSSKFKKMQQQRSCSPVENLRRQLQKLEDLEDQFPQHSPGDTYHLRYPFSDGQKFEGSSELEFFRHRIHLERDSIKRAKESLRTQKCLFQQRQNDLKLKHGSMARHTLQQLCQEEKDLTDMEVSLHRTRSLLGEKVIRLRHLEQSLQRATAASNEQTKLDEATLSDLSSHSASSGISSTEFATAADGARTILRGEHLQESSEIIQSLENLNLEIREIWEVLNQQQKAGNMAPVMPIPLVYPDLGWPVLAGTATVPAPPSIPTLADRLHNYRQHVALANAQSTVVTHAANQGATTTLVERTRNLRHWLRQAGIDPGLDGVTPQATL